EQRSLGAGAAIERFERLSRLRFVHAAGLQQPHPAENAGRGRPQLVREGGQEFVLEAIRGIAGGAGSPLAFQQAFAFGLYCLPLTDVTERLDRADRLAGAIADARLHVLDRMFRSISPDEDVLT